MLPNTKTIDSVARNVLASIARAWRSNTSGGPFVPSDVFSTPDVKPHAMSSAGPTWARLRR